jgi:hypothetical protein
VYLTWESVVVCGMIWLTREDRMMKCCSIWLVTVVFI